MHYLSAWHVGLDVLGWLFVDHLKRFPLFCRSNSLIDDLASSLLLSPNSNRPLADWEACRSSLVTFQATTGDTRLQL